MSRSVSNNYSRAIVTTLILIAFSFISPIPASAGALAGYCASFRGNRIFNTCDRKIFVMWYDNGYCTSVTGCGDWVGANSQSAIMEVKGSVRSAACFWPETPHRVGSALAWSGEVSYECKE